MIPVYQTVHGPRGNCYAACIASILEVPLDALPARATLAAWDEPPAGYGIASMRVRDNSIHAVVCLDGKIVHDPAGRPFAQPEDPVLLWTTLEPLR